MWHLHKFATITEARIWREKFVVWYNTEHLHSALKFVTPEQRHNGDDVIVRQNRHVVYEEARRRNPQRWSGNTRNWSNASTVTLNHNKNLI